MIGLFTWFAHKNPARELSLIGHTQHRERVKQRARQIRTELGLPPHKGLG